MAAEECGHKLPEERKTLKQDIHHYFSAFIELHSCRNNGMSVGSIPWTAINKYAEAYGYSGESYFRLISYIREMDNLYIEKSNKK